MNLSGAKESEDKNTKSGKSKATSKKSKKPSLKEVLSYLSPTRKEIPVPLDNRRCSHGTKYVPIRIAELVKNESILIPEETELDISCVDKQTLMNSNYNAKETDCDSERGHKYCPTRMSYRDRCLLEKKLDYYLQSVEKLTTKRLMR